MRLRHRLLCTAIVAGVVACGGSEGTKPTPVQPTTPFVSAVSVTPDVATVETSQSTTLKAEVHDQNGALMSGKLPTWASSNPAVATVNATTGVVLGVAAGSVTISAA